MIICISGTKTIWHWDTDCPGFYLECRDRQCQLPQCQLDVWQQLLNMVEISTAKEVDDDLNVLLMKMFGGP